MRIRLPYTTATHPPAAPFPWRTLRRPRMPVASPAPTCPFTLLPASCTFNLPWLRGMTLPPYRLPMSVHGICALTNLTAPPTSSYLRFDTLLPSTLPCLPSDMEHAHALPRRLPRACPPCLAFTRRAFSPACTGGIVLYRYMFPG